VTSPAPAAPYQGVRVAVLGASGFVGRWVAQALAGAGARVILVVRDRRRSARVFSRLGIVGNVEERDLGDPSGVRELFRAMRPAVTFNLAGYGVDRAERDEATAGLINDRLVGWIADALATWRDGDWPGPVLVHTGSGAEYGPVEGGRFDPSGPGPTTLYGRTKLAGTRTLAECAARRRLPSVTARLFTVYGPGEHPGRLLPSLLAAASAGTPLPLTGGAQRRDFTYVEDVAEGLLRLGAAACRPGEALNLATGTLCSVREFAEQAADSLGMPRAQLEFGALPLRGDEVAYPEVPIGRLRELTGWSPPTAVAGGIRRTIEVVRQLGGEADG
jgi:nucleoside-diphosphate-sugar epimerase